MEDNKILKRKRSESFKHNSVENLYSNKIFKGDKNSLNKKRFIQNGNNKKKYNNYNDTYLKATDKTKIVYPNHFWFGGSNNDPLNLNGLNDSEDISHHITPLPSLPFTSPHRHDFLVPVAHAVNIYDPLNLCGEEDDDLFFKKRNRTRKRRHSRKKSRSKSRLNSLSDEGNTEGNLSTGSEKTSSELSCFKVNLLSSSENKNQTLNFHPNYSAKTTFDKLELCENVINEKESKNELQSMKYFTTKHHKALITSNHTQSRIKNVHYQHGNYNLFTNYLHPDIFDSRLETLLKSTFEGKDVLDIGCGVGHCSILMALKLGARSVHGVDINAKLIQAAKKNLCYAANNAYSDQVSNKKLCHLNIHQTQSNITSPHNISKNSSLNNNTHNLLKSLSPSTSHSLMNFDFKTVNNLSSRINPTQNIDVKALNESQTTEQPELSNEDQFIRNMFKTFPHNVTFTQQDYIPLSNLEVNHITPQYDVIIAFTLTKYIHLNYGDKGLKLMFRKMYQSLRPGGMLLLQAHHWISYKKHQHRTEHTSNIYKKIKFFPWHFEEHLISLGFSINKHLNNNFKFTYKHKASHQFMLQLKKSYTETNILSTKVSSINHPLPPPTSNQHPCHNKCNVDDDESNDDGENEGCCDCSFDSVVSNVDSSSMNAFNEADDNINKCHDDDADDESKCNDDDDDEKGKFNDDDADDESKFNDDDDDKSKCNDDDEKSKFNDDADDESKFNDDDADDDDKSKCNDDDDKSKCNDDNDDKGKFNDDDDDDKSKCNDDDDDDDKSKCNDDDDKSKFNDEDEKSKCNDDDDDKSKCNDDDDKSKCNDDDDDDSSKCNDDDDDDKSKCNDDDDDKSKCNDDDDELSKFNDDDDYEE